MWNKLRNLLRRLRTGPIQTIDDIERLVKKGVIRWRIYRVGDVQSAVFETGLSPEENAKILIRSFHRPAGIWMYVHRACVSSFQNRLPAQGNVIFPPATTEWTPQQLIGRFSDITHCDECGQAFTLADDGYFSYWLVSPEEFRLWQEVQQENR
jgi:hypothetical protein